MSRLLREWQSRTLAEYRSAAITAQLLHWSIQAGLPQELLDTAVRIVGDELAHAQLCAGVVEALGGTWAETPVETGSLASPVAPEGLLASLIDSLVPNFLFGETLAVPLFNGMRRGSSHPAVLAVLERVLRDEAVHRAHGWATLDALLELDEAGVRARVQALLPATLQQFRAAYVEVDGPPVSPEERAAGLLDPVDWSTIAGATIAGDLAQRFASRGILLPLDPQPATL